jgi:hypothetical protein
MAWRGDSRQKETESILDTIRVEQLHSRRLWTKNLMLINQSINNP